MREKHILNHYVPLPVFFFIPSSMPLRGREEDESAFFVHYSPFPAGVPRFVSSRSHPKAWWVGHLCRGYSDPIWTQRTLSPHDGSALSRVYTRHAYRGKPGVSVDILYAQARMARKASDWTGVIAGLCRGSGPCHCSSEHSLSSLTALLKTTGTSGR